MFSRPPVTRQMCVPWLSSRPTSVTRIANGLGPTENETGWEATTPTVRQGRRRVGGRELSNCAFAAPSAPLLATARGGNVIGGGDWSEDRLIPDLVRAVGAGEPLVIRSPRATRPWQHVLDCLSGYLLLGQRLLAGDATCADAWNFGPDGEGNRTVEQVLRTLLARGHSFGGNGIRSPATRGGLAATRLRQGEDASRMASRLES